MDNSMDRERFLELLTTSRAEWETLLEEVGDDRMEEPGVMGDWTVKDIVAHVAWFEREMVGVLSRRALVGSDLWSLGHDERNAIIYGEQKGRPLDEVLAEAGETYARLLQEVQALDDTDLVDASRFAEMPPDWLPWQMLAGNCYEHYEAHEPDIREWLGRST